MIRLCVKLTVIALALFASAVQSSTVVTKTTVIADKLAFPWSMAALPEGGFVVTLRGGQLIYVAPNGSQQPIELSLPDLYATAQAGLFEVLLAPDFSSTRELVLSYACGNEAANNTCVVKGTLSAQAPYSVFNTQNIFTALPKKAGAAHFGARMTWLADNTLLLALGDGFVHREQAQLLDNHFGKIVRIHRDGSTPNDNPYKHSQASQIFSYGHRNVQGLIYDEQRDVIWQHEHGPKGGDELNKIVAGGNYGWPIATYGIDYTGAKVSPFNQLPGVKAPLYTWTPSLAPAGLALYNGDLLVSHLVGRRLQRFHYSNGSWTLTDEYLSELGQRLRAVYTSPDNQVYVLTDSAEGQLIKVELP